MGISRRHFLQYASAAFGKAAIPSTPIINSIPENITINTFKTWELSSLLRYSQKFYEGLQTARVASNKDCKKLSEGLYEASNTLSFFNLRKGAEHLTWHDILRNSDKLDEIYNYDTGFVTNREDLAQLIKAFASHPEYKNIPLERLYTTLRKRLIKVIHDNEKFLEGFDWVQYAQDSDEPIEAIFQLLTQCGEDLPTSIFSALKQSYGMVSHFENLNHIKQSVQKNKEVLKNKVRHYPFVEWRLVHTHRVNYDFQQPVYCIVPCAEDEIKQNEVIQHVQDLFKLTYGHKNILFSDIYYDPSMQKKCVLISSENEKMHGELEEMAEFYYAQQNPEKLTEAKTKKGPGKALLMDS